MGEVAVRGGRFEGCLFFFGLYGLFISLLFHTITTTIMCDIVYISANISANDRILWVIIASVDYNIQ